MFEVWAERRRHCRDYQGAKSCVAASSAADRRGRPRVLFASPIAPPARSLSLERGHAGMLRADLPTGTMEFDWPGGARWWGANSVRTDPVEC